MRRQALSLTWTPGVRPEEAQVMVRTVQDVLDLLRSSLGRPGQFDPLPHVRVFGAWMIPSVPQGAAYWGIEWYVRNSLNPTQEFLIGSRYLSVISMEPWQYQDPHFDMALTDMPLVDNTISQEPFVLGVVRPGLATVVSAHLLKKSLESRSDRVLALQHMVAHFFGRMADVPSQRGRSDVIVHEDTLYCKNTCVMRLAESAEQALEQARQERAAEATFCEPCQLDLITALTGFHYGLN